MKHRRMFKVELYGRVRRAVLVEGRSQRAVAREFGIARKTIQKMLRYSVPPGYKRQQAAKRPKLGPWLGVIDAILEEDKRQPARQGETDFGHRTRSNRPCLLSLPRIKFMFTISICSRFVNINKT
ncbi:MAG: hypothetical protein ABR866_18600 [Candidatus Korobacteraceae bacterium]